MISWGQDFMALTIESPFGLSQYPFGLSLSKPVLSLSKDRSGPHEPFDKLRANGQICISTFLR